MYVADGQADITALMQRAAGLGTPAHWLIRSTHDRSLDGGEKRWPKVLKTCAVGEIQFVMAARAGQSMKRVTLESGLALTCVIAREIDPPGGVQPVEWRLLTNREPVGRDDLVALIDWYRARWEIEMFFHVLRRGCRVQALQLWAVDRIERALALFMIVAWRIACLMRLGRTELKSNLVYADLGVIRRPVVAEPVRCRSPVLHP